MATDLTMAQSEHPLKDRNQHPGFRPHLIDPLPEAKLNQLATGHNTVLAFSKLPDHPRRLAVFHRSRPPNTRNCINFSTCQIEKLMQFGW